MSNNKMKGLLKGLRYISQIFGMQFPSLKLLSNSSFNILMKQCKNGKQFMCCSTGDVDRNFNDVTDNDEEEPEMQIGFPTDVKHVAHIGWDGPSVNSPSWVNVILLNLFGIMDKNSSLISHLKLVVRDIEKLRFLQFSFLFCFEKKKSVILIEIVF
jgi:hypothetical protein